jgi:hypothetical protein
LDDKDPHHGRVNAIALLRVVAAGQHGVVTARQCREAGLPPDTVKRLLRQRHWLRLSRGAYLVEPVPSRLATIRAASFSAGPAAVAVLGTAAEVHGIAGVHQSDAVHLSLPGVAAKPRRSTEATVHMHQFRLSEAEVTTVQGIAVTTVARTVADLLLRVDRYTGVAMLDSALNRRLLTSDELELVGGLMAGRPGSGRSRQWLTEADGRAESPLETRVRLRATDGGVPPDALQYRVTDRSGDIIAITDLAWTYARIIGEADGVDAHDNPTAVFRDRTRQNAIVNAGYTPLRFVWADTLDPSDIPRTIRAAIRRS